MIDTRHHYIVYDHSKQEHAFACQHCGDRIPARVFLPVQGRPLSRRSGICPVLMARAVMMRLEGKVKTYVTAEEADDYYVSSRLI